MLQWRDAAPLPAVPRVYLVVLASGFDAADASHGRLPNATASTAAITFH